MLLISGFNKMLPETVESFPSIFFKNVRKDYRGSVYCNEKEVGTIYMQSF